MLYMLSVFLCYIGVIAHFRLKCLFSPPCFAYIVCLWFFSFLSSRFNVFSMLIIAGFILLLFYTLNKKSNKDYSRRMEAMTNDLFIEILTLCIKEELFW